MIHQGQRNVVDGMPLRTARRILDHARAGLPVVVVGTLPAGTGSFADRDDDAEVRHTMDMLLAQPVVRVVDGERDIAAALADLHVTPSARRDRPSNLLTLRRTTRDADYYFLLNPNRIDLADGRPDPPLETVAQRVAFEGRGRPVRLDPWTGRVVPIDGWEQQDGRVAIDVVLAPGQSRVIAIGPGGDEPHDDRPAATDVVPRELELSGWRLTVEDWRPGATASETEVVVHEHDLDALRTWPEIAGLEDVSGVGHYTARVELDGEWIRTDRRAWLDLGPLFDSTRVTVNGRGPHTDGPRYVDPDDPVVDVTGLLAPGTNVVEVEIATTLRNRVRTVRPAHAHFDRQPYGLVGPVRLTLGRAGHSVR